MITAENIQKFVASYFENRNEKTTGIGNDFFRFMLFTSDLEINTYHELILNYDNLDGVTNSKGITTLTFMSPEFIQQRKNKKEAERKRIEDMQARWREINSIKYLLNALLNSLFRSK